jgi:hypothetical protein
MSEGGDTGRAEGKADLHIHTALGDGMAELPELLDYIEQQTDLDVIAVTDHDDIRGGLQARELWARGRYRFQVIVGAEVTAIQGHVLALFVEEPVPSLRQVEEILEASTGRVAYASSPLRLPSSPAASASAPWSASRRRSAMGYTSMALSWVTAPFPPA